MSAAEDVLPLASRTSEAWARAALEHPDALLIDHAHLERKAAANALGLLSRWPSFGGDGVDGADGADGAREAVETWTRALATVAKDETEHLALVLRILRERGVAFERLHRNDYAKALRRLVREGKGLAELVDRLLVSALIEARSCERFARLAEVAEEDVLRRLYRGLLASERGHFRLFLELARRVPGVADVEARWEALLRAEADVLAAQPPGPRMHSGEPAGA